MVANHNNECGTRPIFFGNVPYRGVLPGHNQAADSPVLRYNGAALAIEDCAGEKRFLRIAGRTSSAFVATVARRWTGKSPRSGDRSYGRKAEVILPAIVTVRACRGSSVNSPSTHQRTVALYPVFCNVRVNPGGNPR